MLADSECSHTGVKDPCSDPSGDQPIMVQLQVYVNKFQGKGRSRELDILEE